MEPQEDVYVIWFGQGLAVDPCNGSRATNIFKYSEIKDNLCDAVY